MSILNHITNDYTDAPYMSLKWLHACLDVGVYKTFRGRFDDVTPYINFFNEKEDMFRKNQSYQKASLCAKIKKELEVYSNNVPV